LVVLEGREEQEKTCSRDGERASPFVDTGQL
jgi:hypothetical protein